MDGTAFVGLSRRWAALSYEGLDAQDLSLSLGGDAFHVTFIKN
jgi:hypothetical protein